MKTLSELLQGYTQDQILQALLNGLGLAGWQPDDWASGSDERTLLEIEALTQADLYALIPKIAAGGYIDLASGDWLDLRARERWNLTRLEATFARDTLRLTCEPGFGPYEIQAGTLWAATPTGLRWWNEAAGIIPEGGSVELTIKAESPGTAYNLPRNTITRLITPFPGVSCTNVAGGILELGTDRESDDRLRERCIRRWNELGGGATRGAYEFWALSASNAVTHVRVLDEHPRGQGTVDVVLWGTGGIGAADVDTVRADILERRPTTADVQVYAATEHQVQLLATIRVRAGMQVRAEEAAASALAALQRETPIGGTLYHSALVEALFNKAVGVIDVVLDSPLTDIQLGGTEAVTITPTLTWMAV